jgi:hypothetical protein
MFMGVRLAWIHRPVWLAVNLWLNRKRAGF